ncbi:Mitochondrial import inner membrane translocase subunit Tim10 [Amphibalanus amphitrite]|uniref:Mitochondrial import inner membrane translocase subunit n=1 Tax=Amphibalanus amphitrite TaxID=1232801 RepID=A0A6A4VF95_AMPAM|nr:Mitochondrial import inner membrane translocase subunit Tim10 [Amphibalanus amphitrite]
MAGSGVPGGLNEGQMKLMQDLEVEVMADLFNRMTAVCHRKCVPTKYRDSELSKGESVCLDRCVAKYLDVHERIGQKLTNISQAEQEQMKSMMAAQQAAP